MCASQMYTPFFRNLIDPQQRYSIQQDIYIYPTCIHILINYTIVATTNNTTNGKSMANLKQNKKNQATLTTN